jgi:hypothetical protein
VPAPRSVSRLTPFAIAILAMVAIWPSRRALNTSYLRSRVENDVYPLPPPQQTVVLSLGYRAALADLIFAHVLVSSGIHFQEKRSFEFVGNYLDAINELDPKFEKPYRLADTLLTLQVKQVGAENYRKARAILERGMKELPFDGALWTSAGQYLAYLAPGGLTDRAEQDEFRLAGARVLAHACELVGDDANLPYHCIVAAGLLTNAGAQEASREFLERVLMVNDDPDIRAMATRALAKTLSGEAKDRAQDRYQRFQRAWGSDLPFVTRGAYLAVGPAWEPAACAGRSASCPTSWRAWAAAHEASNTPANSD